MMLMLIFAMAMSSPEIPTNGSDHLGDQVHPAEEGLILAIPSQDKTNYVLNWYWCLLNMLHSLCNTDLLGRGPSGKSSPTNRVGSILARCPPDYNLYYKWVATQENKTRWICAKNCNKVSLQCVGHCAALVVSAQVPHLTAAAAAGHEVGHIFHGQHHVHNQKTFNPD